MDEYEALDERLQCKIICRKIHTSCERLHKFKHIYALPRRCNDDYA